MNASVSPSAVASSPSRRRMPAMVTVGSDKVGGEQGSLPGAAAGTGAKAVAGGDGSGQIVPSRSSDSDDDGGAGRGNASAARIPARAALAVDSTAPPSDEVVVSSQADSQGQRSAPVRSPSRPPPVSTSPHLQQSAAAPQLPIPAASSNVSPTSGLPRSATKPLLVSRQKSARFRQAMASTGEVFKLGGEEYVMEGSKFTPRSQAHREQTEHRHRELHKLTSSAAAAGSVRSFGSRSTNGSIRSRNASPLANVVHVASQSGSDEEEDEEEEEVVSVDPDTPEQVLAPGTISGATTATSPLARPPILADTSSEEGSDDEYSDDFAEHGHHGSSDEPGETESSAAPAPAATPAPAPAVQPAAESADEAQSMNQQLSSLASTADSSEAPAEGAAAPQSVAVVGSSDAAEPVDTANPRHEAGGDGASEGGAERDRGGSDSDSDTSAASAFQIPILADESEDDDAVSTGGASSDRQSSSGESMSAMLAALDGAKSSPPPAAGTSDVQPTGPQAGSVGSASAATEAAEAPQAGGGGEYSDGDEYGYSDDFDDIEELSM